MSERDIARHVSTGELLRTGSVFKCNICSSPLGQQPMLHIQGSAHKNAVFLQALSQPSKYKALYNALPKVVKNAHSKGVVTVKGSKFDCGPCSMVFSGEKPLNDHLTSSKHLNKAAVFVPKTRPALTDHNIPGSFRQSPSGTNNLKHTVVTNAIRDGHVKAIGSTYFQCTLCPGTNVITGVEPMIQHLEGKGHKKSLQGPSQPALPSTYPPAGKANAGANYPYGFDAGPVPMQSTGKAAEGPSAQPCSAYKNSTSPRGIVVIFNYIFKNNLESLRSGARKDHENLQAVFTKLGYEVWPTNIDLTRQETLNKLDEVRKSPKLREVDPLITVFLSHGGPAENEFLAFDKQTISVDEILYTKFTDQECPAMKGKPKLFIFNYCRGKVTPSNPVQFDNWSPNTHQLEAPSDVAVIQATLPHFMAGRYPDTGTIFVCEFCKVLEQNSGGMELVEIIHETSNQMRKDTNGNTPTVTSIHFRKFKFM